MLRRRAWGGSRRKLNGNGRMGGCGNHSCSLPARNYVLNNSFNNFALCDGIYENANPFQLLFVSSHLKSASFPLHPRGQDSWVPGSGSCSCFSSNSSISHGDWRGMSKHCAGSLNVGLRHCITWSCCFTCSLLKFKCVESLKVIPINLANTKVRM